jgi:hypothetical protein
MREGDRDYRYKTPSLATLASKQEPLVEYYDSTTNFAQPRNTTFHRSPPPTPGVQVTPPATTTTHTPVVTTKNEDRSFLSPTNRDIYRSFKNVFSKLNTFLPPPERVTLGQNDPARLQLDLDRLMGKDGGRVWDQIKARIGDQQQDIDIFKH